MYGPGMVRKFSFSIIILLWFCNVYSVMLPPAGHGNPRGKFIVLSDIHFDPCGESLDSNIYLVRAAMDSAFNAANNSDFVFFLGDYVRHDVRACNYSGDVVSTMRRISLDEGMVVMHYWYRPDTVLLHPPVFTVGNDDLNPNYCFPRDGDGGWADLVIPMVKRYLDEAQLQSLRLRGSYVARSKGLKIISLNTILFLREEICESHRWKRGASADPLGILGWLESQLSDAQNNNEKVWIIGHVPPGSDRYTLNNPYWTDDLTKRYLYIIQRYSRSVIKAQFFGHEHANWFRLVTNTSHDPAEHVAPLLLHSAVSPIYGNRPSFRVYEYDKVTFSILDFAEYQSEDGLNFTQVYPSFVKRYNMRSFDSTGFADLACSFYQNETLFASYQNLSLGFPKSKFTSTCKQPMSRTECMRSSVCNMLFLDQAKYASCVNDSTRTLNAYCN